MEIRVEYLGASQFEITARQHTIISDQPAENGGDDEGMTPPELLLASLASCAAYYAVDYLKRSHLKKDGVQIRVTADKVTGTFRLDNFRIAVELDTELNEEQLKGMNDAVHHCLIHNTLLHPPKVEFKLKATAAISA